MGKWVHRLSNKRPEEGLADCAECGPNVKILRASARQWRCVAAARLQSSPYKRFKHDTCERCGFVAENLAQMDIHHRDHNHKNNSSENLANLCANCHRLQHLGV